MHRSDVAVPANACGVLSDRPQVVTSFEAGGLRTATLIVLVGAMAYTTAFMETLTISGFPYYTFLDRNMAYVIGSAFYGIYFIVR